MQTPEEIAAAVVGTWYAGPYPLHHDTAEIEIEIADVATVLRAYGAAQVRQERERCAGIADQHNDRLTAAVSTKRAIAAAIRLGLEL